MNFFSYDSKFSQLILKLCYSSYLNLLWLLFSIPIFTIGASTTALYYVCFKIVDGTDDHLARRFWQAFRDNFRQSTVIWLIMLAAGLLLAGDIYILHHLFSSSEGAAAVMWTLMLAAAIAASVGYVIILMYVFPLVASVINTNWAMIKNSFLIGTHYLFCTILVFAIHFAMFVAVVRLFTPIIVFGEGLCALLSSYLLIRVIRVSSYDPNAVENEDGVDGSEEEADK